MREPDTVSHAAKSLLEIAVNLADESATGKLGHEIAEHHQKCPSDACLVIALSGPLGAGKTTLVRGYLRGLGFKGRVRSPTYTLVEPYEISNRSIVHIDLYRLSDPGEIEFLGIGDLHNSTLLIEWPERGPRLAALADCSVNLDYRDDHRRAVITAYSEAGVALLNSLVASQKA